MICAFQSLAPKPRFAFQIHIQTMFWADWCFPWSSPDAISNHSALPCCWRRSHIQAKQQTAVNINLHMILSLLLFICSLTSAESCPSPRQMQRTAVCGKSSLFLALDPQMLFQASWCTRTLQLYSWKKQVVCLCQFELTSWGMWFGKTTCLI